MRRAAKVDMEGQRYGRLVVLAMIAGSKTAHRKVVVRCDCGVEKTTWAEPLRRGVVVSCGCHKRETTIQRSTRHGLHSAPEYYVWTGMKARCMRSANTNYKYYGALGVKVCSEWARDFSRFLADMGPRPTDDHTIDRINPFGDYEPGNCRWATWTEQANNKRANYV